MPHAHQEQAGMPPFSNYKGEDIMAFRSLRKTEKHRRKEPAMITQDMLGELLQLRAGQACRQLTQENLGTP